MKLVTLLALGSALAAPVAMAAPGVATAQLTAKEVKLGEPFTVAVDVSSAPDVTWRPAPLPHESPFAILGAHRQGAQLDVELGLYALGPQSLPGLTLVSSDHHELRVPSAGSVTGKSDLARGDTKLRPLTGPRVPQVFAWHVALALGAGALALVCFGAWAIRALVRRFGSEERRERRRLEKLLHSDVDDVAFYDELDAILRRHLRRRLHIPALQSTSAELEGALAAHPELPAPELHTLFHQADLVKFAARPARADGRTADGALALRLLSEPAPSRRGAHGPALS